MMLAALIYQQFMNKNSFLAYFIYLEINKRANVKK